MAFSLYDASAANFVQTLEAVVGFLGRAADHFQEKGIDAEEIVGTRLFPDMRPLRFQIVSVVHHSRGALEGIRNGVFSPDMGPPDLTYRHLRDMVLEAHEVLIGTDRDAVNAMVGRTVVFKAGDLELPFAAEDFLMSLSLPNFYFHATTAYDILRHEGVPLGKRDFMGRLRVKAQQKA